MGEQNKSFYNHLMSARINTSELKYHPNVAIPAYHVSPSMAKYFDENGVFHIVAISEAYEKIDGIMVRDDGSYYIATYEYAFFGASNDKTLCRKALNSIKPGDTWNDFVAVCETIKFDINRLSFIERFIAKIGKPSYERVPENSNTDTFDFVKIELNLSSITDDVVKTVKDNMSEILEIALNKIENDKRFKKYGVPINVLRLSNAVITKQMILALVFELKIIE